MPEKLSYLPQQVVITEKSENENSMDSAELFGKREGTSIIRERTSKEAQINRTT